MSYYKILEVDESADSSTIKSKYKELAKRYHPDKNPNNKEAEEKFKQINEAYETLGNESKKKDYDAKQAQKFNSYSDFNYRDYQSTVDDFYSKFWNTPAQTKGKNTNYILRLELEEADSGCKPEITLIDGKIRITVEPGIKNNAVLKIKGKGEKSLDGGERGDLIITVMYKEHKVFKVDEDNDLTYTHNMKIADFVLGCEIIIPTLTSKIKLKVPKGTQIGTILKINGAGINKGSYKLELKTEVPKFLTPQEESLWSELQKL